ncbi:beta-N-acetylhexosaminidase [Pseudobacteriovorax antillogorgiicola]|uniref:beta-N-acetylhexosaminidase n=1 Tax=Pseudobacteriovorax antillogorgiicola TaxID=1513793 RepID=A0A1Y6BUI9_9BACT|nr:beta-N-acetylhexosaminidase [Pseudobacteriovorax antillogorgiicola]TCS52362.1 beta-N-acetylhexosaminidase [Pseudobacteriovorax antillogorgiicola]SMF29463.1 beta-N-acetylhexosaminidase [Pseudobacteriovorax antillogorgiicola]
MSGPDAASQILVAALEGLTLSQEEQSFFKRECPAGVTLFRRNLSSSFVAIRSLCQQLHSLLDRNFPPVIAIDQEGGRVSRIPSPFPNLGAPQDIQDPIEIGEQIYLENYGFIMGSSLRGLGINVNFAPVCDVNTNPSNIAIGDRAFSNEPKHAARRAEAFLNGLQSSGVKGCLKHFPGQGDAGDDTHLKGTTIPISRDVLWDRELLPFRSMLSMASMVMLSHAVFSEIDSQPASLSKRIMVDLLQEELEFRGVLVTDDMNMKAIPQDEQSWADAIIEAVSQGADMVLVCRDLGRCKLALERLRGEAAQSPAFSKRLQDAAHKVNSLRATLF